MDGSVDVMSQEKNLAILCYLHPSNDLTIGWQILNPRSHPKATLVPLARKARASGENLNYVHDTSATSNAKCRNFELV